MTNNNRRIFQYQSIILITVALVFGVCLRFYNLDQKVYSFDETYTSTYTYSQHSSAYSNYDGEILSVDQVKSYVFINPEKTLKDAIYEVSSKVYVFPPLYPVLSLIWSKLLDNFIDSSIWIQRSLSAIFSVIALLALYWCSLELFQSHLVAICSVALAAISPFNFQYAQIIRPYSILMATMIVSCGCFLKSLRTRKAAWWFLYSFSIIIGLYSNLLFGFVLISHTAYLILIEQFKFRRILLEYCLSVGLGTLMFLPWFWSFINSRMLSYSMGQVSIRSNSSFLGLAKSWFKGIQTLFVDCYNEWFTSDVFRPIQWILTIFIFLILSVSFYRLCRFSYPKVKYFILALAVAGGLVLMVKDVLTGSSISSRLRYMLPFSLSLELMVAYWIGSSLESKSRWQRKSGQVALAITLGSGLLSCLIIAKSPSWTAFGSPYFPEIAPIIREANQPLVIVTDLDRMLSMSFLVDSDTQFRLIKQDFTIPFRFETIFALEPSMQVKEELEKRYILEEVDSTGRLFSVQNKV